MAIVNETFTCALDKMFRALWHLTKRPLYFLNRSEVVISVPCSGSPLIFELACDLRLSSFLLTIYWVKNVRIGKKSANARTGT